MRRRRSWRALGGGGGRCGWGGPAACSLARNAPALGWCSSAGPGTPPWCSGPPDLDQALEVAQLQASGWAITGGAPAGRRPAARPRRHDLGPLLAFGLGLRAMAPSWSRGAGCLELDQRHHTPRLGVPSRISRMATLMRSVSARVWSRVLADHLAQGGLGDLVDGRGHVLDRDHRLGRIHHPVVGHAETSTLTLSRVMMPWDWMGMVTIRSDTRRSTSISGTINRRPGSRPRPPGPGGTARPSRTAGRSAPTAPTRQHQHRHHEGDQPTAHVCSLLARLPDRGDLQFLLWPSSMLWLLAPRQPSMAPRSLSRL